MSSSVRYYLVETLSDGCALFVRDWSLDPIAFRDKMTAEVLADGLRHKGRTIEVVEIDLATEEPLL